MESIDVREVEDKDLKDFEAIYITTVQNQFPEYSQNIRDYFIEEYKTNMLGPRIKLGAFVDKKLAGYLIADNKPYGGILYVNWLAVLDQYQKKGIGKVLLRKIESIALELGSHAIHLEASRWNISFYTSYGYKEYGYDENGYFGTDNYLMKKELRQPDEKNFLKEYLSKKSAS